MSKWRHSVKKLPTEGVPCWPWGAAGLCVLEDTGEAGRLWEPGERAGWRQEANLSSRDVSVVPSYWQRWPREKYLKDPGPFSQSSQKGVNLELRGNTLITSTGSDVSRNVIGCTSCMRSDAFLHTFLDIELTDKKVGTICSPERYVNCPPMTQYVGASSSSHLVNPAYSHSFSFSFLIYILCPF